jgi:hypothetical protein
MSKPDYCRWHLGALNEATFKWASSKQGGITEIMYNPIDGNDYEFIELKNVGDGG